MLAISDIACGESGKDANDLKTLIKYQIDMLDDESISIFNQLNKHKNPLSQKDDIKIITERIIANVTKTMNIRYKDLQKYKLRIHGQRGGESLNVLEEVGVFFTWLFGGGEDIEGDYVMQMEACLWEYRTSGVIESDLEIQELFSLINQGEEKEKKAWLLEKALRYYETKREQLKKTECGCRELLRDVILRLQNQEK